MCSVHDSKYNVETYLDSNCNNISAWCSSNVCTSSVL